MTANLRDTRTATPVDLPLPEILGRMITNWQENLARTAKPQAYLKQRGLWSPETLRTFRVGYSSGKFPQKLPRDEKLREALSSLGVLNAKGNEFFYNRLVVPIFDETGGFANVYGRALDSKSEVPHLYLPGPRRSVFNRVGIQNARMVILTESILDALSLIVLGFTNTTASYGTQGFTADHRTLFQQARTERVYCAYDADPAGDLAADQLAHDLAVIGVEVLRVTLPAKDPNDFLRDGGTREQFQALLDQAVAMLSLPTRETPVATETPAEVPSPSSTLTIPFGERVYEVAMLPRRDELSLRIRLKVRHEGKNFVDVLNLYSDRSRTNAVNHLLKIFGESVTRSRIEGDLSALIDALEAKQRQQDQERTSTEHPMTETERVEVMEFLRSPRLASWIREDLTHLGVVGEEDSKLLVYLVATSRRLKKPLSLMVVSRSSAGKSFLVLKVSELMPEEEVKGYTRMSSKALFHDEPERLKHKLLTLEEAHGMADANYAIRVMQSNQMLRNLTTITDPTTGRHKAQENVVYGPVALIVTTTEDLDFETLTRAFVISVDESVAQTERIHQMQRSARTLEGLASQMKSARIIRRHRNAQRLLQCVAVVNNLAEHLTFPTGTLRLRREHDKYLTLIEAVTYLFQCQRRAGVYTDPESGEQVPYVETALEDIDLANELMVASLRQAFDEVSAPTRSLLLAIRKMLSEQVGEDEPLSDIRFSRRKLREFTRWSDHPVRDHLKKLEELEYIHAVSGSNGREYVYTLTPDHRLAVSGERPMDEQIRELGLRGSSDLKKMLKGKWKP